SLGFHADAGYDANSRLIGITYFSGFRVQYSYNSLGYLSQLSEVGSVQPFWTANSRDAELHTTQATYGNGISTTRGDDTPARPLLHPAPLIDIRAGGGDTYGVANFTYK